jgi:hypothetical protein
MNKKFELLPPLMPNYARFKKEPGLRQDGFKADGGYPIEKLTKEEAAEYAELMKQAFIEHWEAKQK